MSQKLEELFPEDLFLYSQNLTDGEIEVLVELDEALEKYLRPIITEYTEKAEFPLEAFYKVVNEVGILNDKRLYEGKTVENRFVPSQYYYGFLWYLLSRFDAVRCKMNCNT